MLVNPKADGWSSALEKRLAASGSLMFRGGLREGCSKTENPFSFDVAQSDFDMQGLLVEILNRWDFHKVG